MDCLTAATKWGCPRCSLSSPVQAAIASGGTMHHRPGPAEIACVSLLLACLVGIWRPFATEAYPTAVQFTSDKPHVAALSPFFPRARGVCQTPRPVGPQFVIGAFGGSVFLSPGLGAEVTLCPRALSAPDCCGASWGLVACTTEATAVSALVHRKAQNPHQGHTITREPGECLSLSLPPPRCHLRGLPHLR